MAREGGRTMSTGRVAGGKAGSISQKNWSRPRHPGREGVVGKGGIKSSSGQRYQKGGHPIRGNRQGERGGKKGTSGRIEPGSKTPLRRILQAGERETPWMDRGSDKGGGGE